MVVEAETYPFKILPIPGGVSLGINHNMAKITEKLSIWSKKSAEGGIFWTQIWGSFSHMM